ncbi:unnamed protein product [Rhizopus stolonifer]
MIQKSKDWDGIAEQLGIPTPYVVHHAAFLYQTQLSGIHKQLRKNTGRKNHLSKPRQSTLSIRYSDTFQPLESKSSSSERNGSLLTETQETENKELSEQLERIEIDDDGPAFLPRRSVDNLNDSHRMSLSIQNLNRTITPQHTSSPQATASNSNNQSALNSVTSSFSDLSDTSVTQSALEDAFMSKFNHGSKMSILNFSRRM